MLKRLITCLTVLLIITGCNKNKQEEAILRVVTSADQAPFEFFNSSTNSIEGFDVDLAKEIAKRLNMGIVILDMDFGGLLPSLQSGQADMAIAGFMRTPEREKTIDFTNAYYQPKMGVVFAKGASADSFEGLRIGVQLGTYHHMLLEAMVKSGAHFEIWARNRLLDLVQELLSGNIHIVIMDYIPATKFVNSNQQKLALKEFVHPDAQSYAIALPKNSPLKEKIDQVLKQLKEEGFIKKLEEKWLTVESEPDKA